jgi:membrane dipeptidase
MSSLHQDAVVGDAQNDLLMLEDDTGGRLTKAGVEAVGLLEELDVLVEVSHLGRAGSDFVDEVFAEKVPA